MPDRGFMHYEVFASFIDDEGELVENKSYFYPKEYNKAVDCYKGQADFAVNANAHSNIRVSLSVVVDGEPTILAQIVDRIGAYIKFVD